jgi:hypothetical protein
LPLPPLYSKSGGKTINAASVEKALAMSQLIFKMKKSHIVVPGPVFGRTKKQTPLAPHSVTFNWGEGVKMIYQPSYSLCFR